MRELLKYMKQKNHLESIMTLSPLTPMATHYHVRNGAKLTTYRKLSDNVFKKLKSYLPSNTGKSWTHKKKIN